MSKLRVLHCPHNIAGQASCQAMTERELGVQSESVTFYETKFSHQNDKLVSLARKGILGREIAKWRLLVKAYFLFDVIHYNFGSTIFELPLPNTKPWKMLSKGNYKSALKYFYQKICCFAEKKLLKNKVIFVTTQGDDIRQHAFTKNNFEYSIAHEVDASTYCARSDYAKNMHIEYFQDIADKIYCLNPDLLYYFSKKAEFLPYGHIQIQNWVASKERDEQFTSLPLVVHAPSHAEAKGTKYVLEAIKALKENNVNFQFLLIQDVSQMEVKHLLEKADLLIDQLLAGWYGGIAVEAMSLGTSVLCYLREPDLKFLPKKMREDLPIINANKDCLYDVLYQWISDFPQKNNRRANREYVKNWHDNHQIAKRVISDYQKIYMSKKLNKPIL